MFKRNAKKILILTFMMSFVILATGCDTWNNFYAAFFAEEQQDTIKIGVLEPTSGEDAELAQDEIKGIELAHEMFPDVLGKEVELVYEDTQSNVYSTEAATQNLVGLNPAAIIGPFGETNALAASEIVKYAKIPSFAIANTNALLTINNPYYFRMKFLDSRQGQALARYCKEGLKATKIAIFRQDGDDTSGELTNTFISEVTSLYGNVNPIVAKPYFNIDETDYTKQLDIIQKSGAKVVFAPVAAEIADLLFAQIEERNMTDITFLNGSGWEDPKFIQVLNKHPQIKCFVAATQKAENTNNDMAKKFTEAYRQKYGDSSEPSESLTLAFDAYVIAIQSIDKAKTVDGDNVRDVLLTTKRFQGAGGFLTFDKDGDPVKTMDINKIENDLLVPVTTYGYEVK